MSAAALRIVSIFAFTLIAGLAATRANPSPAPSTFALLPLVAGDLGLPYAVLPTAEERGALGRKLAFEACMLAAEPKCRHRGSRPYSYERASIKIRLTGSARAPSARGASAERCTSIP